MNTNPEYEPQSGDYKTPIREVRPCDTQVPRLYAHVPGTYSEIAALGPNKEPACGFYSGIGAYLEFGQKIQFRTTVNRYPFYNFFIDENGDAWVEAADGTGEAQGTKKKLAFVP